MWIAAALATPDPSIAARLEAVAALQPARRSREVPAPDERTIRRVEAGHVVSALASSDDREGRVVWGIGIVDAPIASLFAAILDDRNKKAYSELAHHELLQGSPCGDDRVVFQYLDVPMLTDRWWVARQTVNRPLQEASAGRVREMTWAREDGQGWLHGTHQQTAEGGMEVPVTEGGWFLVDLGGDRTWVEFWTRSDPGGRVPAGLAARFAVGSVEATLEKMRDLAVKGPSCKAE